VQGGEKFSQYSFFAVISAVAWNFKDYSTHVCRPTFMLSSTTGKLSNSLTIMCQTHKRTNVTKYTYYIRLYTHFYHNDRFRAFKQRRTQEFWLEGPQTETASRGCRLGRGIPFSNQLEGLGSVMRSPVGSKAWQNASRCNVVVKKLHAYTVI